MLEFDSKSHGDMPRNTSAKNTAGGNNNNNSLPVWEHRRRAGSSGSMDFGLLDGTLLFIFVYL